MARRRRGLKKSGLSHVWEYVMKTLGCVLVVFFSILIALVLYTVFYEVAPTYYYYYDNSALMGGFVLIIGIYLGFGILFNFYMAVLTNPGDTVGLSAKDLNQYQKLRPDTSSQFAMSGDETATEYDDEEDLENLGIKSCRRCASIKPYRAHHCSICDRCVLRMDHHCPWINNCVGHFNQRYFLLMIFYLFAGTVVYTILAFPLQFSRDFRKYDHLRSWATQLAFTLCITIAFIMIPFNGWNWFLVLTGQTTIEFWTKRAESQDPEMQDPNSPCSFGHTDRRKNLQDTFGTGSFFRVLLPSIRPIGRDGFNWEVNPSAGRDSISLKIAY